MRETVPRPTGEMRTFGAHELIVTKTDLKGRMTYANDVFLRVSVFSEDEAIGQPHNIIRHPDMPKAIFKLLWETLAAGQEIFAYVVNLASDGAAYWVLAHVTPSFDARGRIVGYHSSRRLPDPAAIKAAAALYERLRAEEQRLGGQAGLAASWQLMQDLLAERGQTYDQYVWELTNEGAGA
ncbi:PAS domain S-box-containing protein [Actinoplanes campanulatus]|uniref:PAS domain S-box-containing protein n=1 Tax=Actinoplanes campanulatus TaxID=113559 RepID=A0A7W5FER8_9ACTN|nr:PAS domain-containing protein [Actinoplanes campanulatus]MBB3095696.1 PAS domain S-box-containing protein [Actinoplanes campanulatus]GGN10887.1 transcriptional regulator [Actinoplanes campanulatus]GID36591.1 transcriptional regulator [Actinoplanes campanulatus]